VTATAFTTEFNLQEVFPMASNSKSETKLQLPQMSLAVAVLFQQSSCAHRFPLERGRTRRHLLLLRNGCAPMVKFLLNRACEAIVEGLCA
jgi:hypothetical protein